MIKLLKKIKYYLEGRAFVKPEIDLEKQWVGNKYGGFYVHLNNLNQKSIIYSVGIGTDISFDLELVNTFQCKIFGFDPTPKSIHWVKENVNHSKFIMSEFGISNSSGEKKFYLPKNQNNVSGSMLPVKTVNKNESIILEFKTLSEVMQSNKHDYLDLLKMDIEGAEYEVLQDLLNQNIRINQIVVEFHPHMINNGRKKTLEMLKLLKHHGYQCFAVSDSFLEYSFLKTQL